MDLTDQDTHSLLVHNASVREKIAKIIRLDNDKVLESERVRKTPSPSPHSLKPEFATSKVDLDLATIREQSLQAQINELSSNLANVTGVMRVKSQQINKLLKEKSSLEDSHRESLRTRDSVIEEKSKAIDELTRKQKLINGAYPDQDLLNEMNDVNKQLRYELSRLSSENQNLQMKVNDLTRSNELQSRAMMEHIDYAVQCKEHLNQLHLGPDSAEVARRAQQWARELEQRNEGLNKNLKDIVQMQDQIGRLQATAETAATFRASIAQELSSLRALVGRMEAEREAKERNESTKPPKAPEVELAFAPNSLPKSPDQSVGMKRRYSHPATTSKSGAGGQTVPRLGCVYCGQPAYGMMHKCSSCERMFHSACAREPHRNLCSVCSGGDCEAETNSVERSNGETYAMS